MGVGFLDILWLAAAAYTADIYPPFGSLCSNNPSISSLQSACGNVQAGLAFAWLSWIMRKFLLSPVSEFRSNSNLHLLE